MQVDETNFECCNILPLPKPDKILLKMQQGWWLILFNVIKRIAERLRASFASGQGHRIMFK